MGAINYCTSPRICTLGYYFTDYEEPDENDILETIAINNVSREVAKEILRDNFYDSINEDFDAVDSLLDKDKNDWKYYEITVKDGYHEGFYVNFDNVYIAFDEDRQRLEMHKELTQIRQRILKCIKEYGMRITIPHWCPTWYKTIDESYKKLNELIKEERKFINSIKVES